MISQPFSRQVEQQYRQYRESQWYSPEKLRNIQEDKLHSLLSHAISNVPFYRKLANKRQIAGVPAFDYLMDMPVLTRNMLQNFCSELLAEGSSPSAMHLHSSGGTTGEPVRYYLDNRLKVLCRAIERRGDYEWTGTLPSSRKVMLWGRVHVGARSFQLLRGVLNRQWKYHLCSATEKDIDRVIRHLKIIRPGLMMGYASFIGKIARRLYDTNTILTHPMTVISTAELLTEEIKQLAQRAFNCRVYNRYASGEFGLIASECSAGNMHIHSERVLVEVLKNGRTVPPGTEGEIVITDLDNYAFPLIRYVTGDVGVLSESQCSCGRGLPVLNRLSGRVTDYIRTPLGVSILASETFTAFRVICTNQEIRQVQIIQPSLDSIVARVVVDDGYKKAFEDEIRKVLFDLYFHDTGIRRVDFEYVDELPVSASGKIPYYISLL